MSNHYWIIKDYRKLLKKRSTYLFLIFIFIIPSFIIILLSFLLYLIINISSCINFVYSRKDKNNSSYLSFVV